MAYTTINKSADYFNTVLWTGNASARSITGVGFQPDFFWIKQRSSNQGHLLWDALRGGNYYFASSSTAASAADIGTFTAASDGYSFNTDGAYNGNSQTYVGWNWKAGTTGSGTTDQSKDYQYSVNTTSGFSIVRYKGSGVTNHKIPHHLGAKPEAIWVKSTESVHNWTCYWDVFQNSQNYVRLNTSDAVAST